MFLEELEATPMGGHALGHLGSSGGSALRHLGSSWGRWGPFRGSPVLRSIFGGLQLPITSLGRRRSDDMAKWWL